MRFKLDENLPLQLKRLLTESGHDAVTVLDQRMGGATDSEVASACRREERVLLTQDIDFADIRMYPPGNYPGIVVFRLASQSRNDLLEIGAMLIESLVTSPPTVNSGSSKDLASESGTSPAPPPPACVGAGFKPASSAHPTTPHHQRPDAPAAVDAVLTLSIEGEGRVRVAALGQQPSSSAATQPPVIASSPLSMKVRVVRSKPPNHPAATIGGHPPSTTPPDLQECHFSTPSGARNTSHGRKNKCRHRRRRPRPLPTPLHPGPCLNSSNSSPGSTSTSPSSTNASTKPASPETSPQAPFRTPWMSRKSTPSSSPPGPAPTNSSSARPSMPANTSSSKSPTPSPCPPPKSCRTKPTPPG